MINLNFYKTGDGTKQFWGDELFTVNSIKINDSLSEFWLFFCWGGGGGKLYYTVTFVTVDTKKTLKCLFIAF